MVEVIGGYFFARYLMAHALLGVYNAQKAVYDLLALLMFASVAMLLIREVRRFAIPALLLTVVVYVGLSTVFANAGIICTVAGVVTGITLLATIKPRTIRWVRAQENMNHILRWVLYLV